MLTRPSAWFHICFELEGGLPQEASNKSLDASGGINSCQLIAISLVIAPPRQLNVRQQHLTAKQWVPYV